MVDTPGFDDTYRSDVDVLCQLAAWLEETYAKGFRLTGLIYLHRIADARFSGSSLKNLRLFRRLCGKDALSNVLLVTTFWNQVTPEDGSARERELISRPEFWKEMIDRGSRVFRYSKGRGSALEILDAILDRDKVTLQLQRELVDEHKTLADTAAGELVLGELKKLERMHEKEMEELREEMKMAIEERDQEVLNEIQVTLKKQLEQVRKHNEDRLKLTSTTAEDLRRQGNLFRSQQWLVLSNIEQRHLEAMEETVRVPADRAISEASEWNGFSCTLA